MALLDERDRLKQDSFMLDDPIAFNEAVVDYFRRRYCGEIEAVVRSLESEAQTVTNPWLAATLISVRREKLERHLFPIFAAASLSGGVSPDHIRFAIAFVKSISIPVMRTDQYIDAIPLVTDTAYQDPSSVMLARLEISRLPELCLIQEGILDVLALPRGSQILETLARNYRSIYRSLYWELTTRYELTPIQHPKQALWRAFNCADSTLTCKYFSSTVQASILLNGDHPDREVVAIADQFGVIRQLCDQISDLREDVRVGNSSVPLLFAVLREREQLFAAIAALWSHGGQWSGDIQSGDQEDEVNAIFDLVVGYQGFSATARVADSKYRQAIGAIRKYLGPNGEEIELLFRLKRAYLERIKLNGWSDVQGVY